MHGLDRQQFSCRRGQLEHVAEFTFGSRATCIGTARRNTAAYQAENLRRLLHYLRQHPCVDCGESDPVVLDFDQRDASLERAAVSVLIWRASWAVVERQIARCDVRCANCRGRRSTIHYGWRRITRAP
jgi:hypothetical protein